MESAVEVESGYDDWLHGLKDPAFFARRFLKIELHPGQQRWLIGSTARENVLVTGNRWGKSFVSAIKLIRHSLYQIRPLKYDTGGRYRAVVASITQNQANLVFDQVVRLVRQSPIISPLLRNLTWTPHPKLEFDNGATIEARTTQNRGEHLLGNDYDLFIFDEVAFEAAPEYVVEEIILMRLADREGRLDLVSTPNGKNWFYRRARDISQKHRRGFFLSGDSRDNPHISKTYLDERVQYFSESRLKQNIMGQFVDAGGEILRGGYVDDALKRFESVNTVSCDSDKFFLSGWDLARKQTATVGITVEVCSGKARVVELERFKRFDWMVVIEKIKERQEKFPGRLMIDATGLGDVVVEQLSAYRPEAVIFTPATKAELLTNVELMHARGGDLLPSLGITRWSWAGLVVRR
ncbi:MAG: terminase family protein [candidate division Zixibacteria bacterium]|nr:terminase family protein [candidate division Zixibacteria bacterium]